MIRLVCYVLLSLLIFGSTSTSLIASGWKLVGISNAVFRNSGLRAIDNQCKADFGAEARMCFSTEVLATSNWPELEKLHSPGGWVRPVIRLEGTGDSAVWYDVSGTFAVGQDRGLNCAGWNSDSPLHSAIAVVQNGSMQILQCDIGLQIGAVCCLPDPNANPPDGVFCNGFESCP